MKKLQKKQLTPFFLKRPWLVRPFGVLLIVLFPISVLILAAIGSRQVFNEALSIVMWDGE